MENERPQDQRGAGFGKRDSMVLVHIGQFQPCLLHIIVLVIISSMFTSNAQVSDDVLLENIYR